MNADVAPVSALDELWTDLEHERSEAVSLIRDFVTAWDATEASGAWGTAWRLAAANRMYAALERLRAFVARLDERSPE